MEIRARFVLVGVFVLAVVAAGFGFVYWMENTTGLAKRAAYEIRFEQSVSGLLLGSGVQFNGIRVGEVTDLQLDPKNPGGVVVTIAVTGDTPVRSDTKVGLAFGGLSGVPEIALTGGSPDAAPLAASDGGLPVLNAGANAGLDWTVAASNAFSQVQSILTDNSDSLKDAISNIDTFSKALAKNSDKLDGIMDGLARLAGAGGTKSSGSAILAAPTDFPPLAAPPEKQLVIARPTNVVALETQRILAQTGSTLAPAFPDVQWSDSTPLILQSKLVESFENAGLPKVASDASGLTGDYTLLVELRAFQIVSGDSPTVEVDFTAKLTDAAAGTIVATKRFHESAPLSAMQADDAVTAFDKAFGAAARALVEWTLPQLS